MKISQLAPFMFLVVAGCSGKSCGGCGSTESSAPQPPPPVAKDCKTPLGLCLTTLRNTERNLGIVNSVREKCWNLEKKAFAIDSGDKAALAGFDKDPAKCETELKACEDIRSRSLKVMQNAVKALDGCNEEKK